MDEEKQMKIRVIAMFGFAIIMLALGLHIWYSIDSAIDFNYITNQIRTNQTFVDELTCKDIMMLHNTGEIIISPTQQDEVKEMVSELKDLMGKKGCVDWKGD